MIEKKALELFKHRVKNKFNYVSGPTSQRVVVRKEVGRGQRGKKNKGECTLSDLLTRDTEGMGIRMVARGPSDLITH